MKRCIFLYLVCLFFTGNLILAQKKEKRQYDSYKGLIMAGYQGWFNTPEDGAGRGWYHYKGKEGFFPGSCTIDYWPDMEEYSKKYVSPFYFEDGSNALLFSSHDFSSVNLHFKWMYQYGIDGVFMQRFVSEIKNESGLYHFNKVLDHAMISANEYERAISIMYDLSGMVPGDEYRILDDIDYLKGKYDLKKRKKNPSYLYHNGKPLIAIWGVGFNDNRKYSLKEVYTVVEGLKKRGFSVMLGVPTHWRTLSKDAVPDQNLHHLIRKSDIVLPWFVSRYTDETYDKFKKIIGEDILWANNNQIDYVPLVYPGFSWKNMEGPNSFFVPRNAGQFYWNQLSTSISAGAEMIYVAMFDEIDEGTAIFKCAKKTPIGASKFIAIEESIPSDHYLWLTGQAGSMLRKEIPIQTTIPQRNILTNKD